MLIRSSSVTNDSLKPWCQGIFLQTKCNLLSNYCHLLEKSNEHELFVVVLSSNLLPKMVISATHKLAGKKISLTKKVFPAIRSSLPGEYLGTSKKGSCKSIKPGEYQGQQKRAMQINNTR